jgi:AcrR family transcriptional regulator
MSDLKTPKRTQAERTLERKKQLICAAIRFFGQNGYHGARLADIAKAAGVTEPGLLHHFPSKVHLLMNVLAERDLIDQERISSPLQIGEKDPLLPLQLLAEYNETVPGLVQLFTVLVAESIDEKHPAHEFFKQRYQKLREETIEVLTDAQVRNEVRSDIPAEELTVMLFAMMDGLQVQWLYEPEQVQMARLFKQFLDLFRV